MAFTLSRTISPTSKLCRSTPGRQTAAVPSQQQQSAAITTAPTMICTMVFAFVWTPLRVIAQSTVEHSSAQHKRRCSRSSSAVVWCLLFIVAGSSWSIVCELVGFAPHHGQQPFSLFSSSVSTRQEPSTWLSAFLPFFIAFFVRVRLMASPLFR